MAILPLLSGILSLIIAEKARSFERRVPAAP